MTKNISINKDTILAYHYAGKLKALYVYGIAVYLTAGKGYISLKNFKEITHKTLGISKQTAKNWITLLHGRKMIKIRRGMIMPLGKIKLQKKLKTKSNVYIKFSEEVLSSYKEFQYHIIRQLGIEIQDTFTFLHKRPTKKLATSLINQKKIEASFALPRRKDEHGCSISQLVERYEFNKSTVSLALRGHTKHLHTVINVDRDDLISRKKYREVLEIINDLTFRRKYSQREWDILYRYGIRKMDYEALKYYPSVRRLLRKLRKYSYRSSFRVSEGLKGSKSYWFSYELGSKIVDDKQRYKLNNFKNVGKRKKVVSDGVHQCITINNNRGLHNHTNINNGGTYNTPIEGKQNHGSSDLFSF